MFDNKSFNKFEAGSERNFGLVFSIFFLVISFYPKLYGNNIHYWAFGIALIFFILGIFFPRLLILPNKIWFKIGIFLGRIFSPIIMAIIFFIVVTPTGIIMRLLRIEMTYKKFYKSKKTYWIKRKELVRSMKNQY